MTLGETDDLPWPATDVDTIHTHAKEFIRVRMASLHQEHMQLGLQQMGTR